jgi:hypothetical protein
VATENRWKRELLICGVLLATGLVALPVAISAVGQKVVGDYAPGQGALDLTAAIWASLVTLNPWAWLLVLSPYLGITLLRVAWRTFRSRR